MKDYGQVLTGQDQGGQGQGGGQQRSRNRNRNRNRQQNSNSDTDQVQVQVTNQIPRRTKFALANSLGASAEAAKGLGISRRQAHRIIDTAFSAGGGQGSNISE